MFEFLVLVLLVHSLTASPCSQLDLTLSNTNNFDENYSIVTKTLKSSNVIKISLEIKEMSNENFSFVMGASDSSQLIGSWEPFTPTDGQVIDCSLEQAVINENPNLSEFTFYWMAPPSFNSNVTFVATIFEQDATNNKSLVQYIQSTPTQITQKQGRDRFQDVSQSFCTSSPCLNGGTCIFDTQYSYCQCVAPWNGVFCNLQYFHIMLASNMSFTSAYFFNTLNSPSYANLTTDIGAYLNNAFSGLSGNKIYSVNFVSPSPIGTYISVSMALTPTTASYTQFILSALATALSQNSVTALGRQLSIDPAYISNAVTQDSAPYTSCVFPFALAAIDYNFCVPLDPYFVCSRSRVIDLNTTYNSIDCARNIANYVTTNVCFPNICLNGGTCTVVNGAATCTCPAYFTGTRCGQLFGCNPVTNPQAITCTNQATCNGTTCVCASNATIGTLCEIPPTVCTFPFVFMNVTYPTCAVINGQSLCVVRYSDNYGQYPVLFSDCGAPQCQNNPCGNRGTCQNTVSGSFRCLNCATGYSGYFCELQYQTFQLSLNVTYLPAYQNLSSNASQQLISLVNQTLNVALINITNGGFQPNIISFTQNPGGTTSALININTNYINFLNNATQGVLSQIGAIQTVLINTTRTCAPWYIYEGHNVTGCVIGPTNTPICSLTNDFDRDGQYTSCSETINVNLCNLLNCGLGTCVVTSRNLTFCECPTGVTGTNCDQLISCTFGTCLNNGSCVTLPAGTYQCNCTSGFGGAYCQYNVTGCVFPFADNQNQTHNTCVTTADYFGGLIPWCRNALGQPRNCSIDYCAQKPCVFGTCVPSNQFLFGSLYPYFICNCTDGFTGHLCAYAYFRLKALYSVPNISITTLNALESPTTQAYQNLSLMFRNLVINRTNITFDFLPLIYTTFRTATGNYYQITADLSFPGNISVQQISSIITPILSNLPPEFNATYIDNGLLDADEIQPLSAAPNCTLPYEYDGGGLAVCHMDPNGLVYCAYGVNYTLPDRKLCDASGLPTAQYTACETLNITNPCNSTSDFPILCVASDTGYNCFCTVTQTLGLNCANLDFCRTGALLCLNNATCVNRPDLNDFACNCSYPYYGRYCQNFGLGYTFYLVNYTNLTSPGVPTLVAILNQTIINITNGSVIANTITISPAGQVTISVTGTNYTVPQFELPLFNSINNNLTVGPFLLSYNQTNLVPIQTNATCVFPFAYNGVNYTTCITIGYGFPWCSTTAVFNGYPLDCRNVNWCASGPCLHNGTCINNQQLGTFQCNCVSGYVGVTCAYPSTTVTIVVSLGNNTLTNVTLLNITSLLPNGTTINTIQPGPNNTLVIVIVVNSTTAPNITLPNQLNITIQPTQTISGCVFPFIYNNRSYSTCIPISANRTTFCCQNANCDLNPQWQFCNNSNLCASCAPNAGCSLSPLGIVTCVCPAGYTGALCDIPVNLCAQNNRTCLNNGVCLVNPNTSVAYCNCTSAGFTGAQCEIFLPCLSNPCLNNGTCFGNSTGAVQCNCTRCYGGSLCQTPDYCCLQVCSPNGICLSGVNGTYTCICQPNYVGVNCTTFNPCAVLPCLNNGTCVVTNSSSYQCLCPPGLTGANCATTVNPCASLPCQNNGQCITLGNQFLCICTLGFNGTLCQTPINPCSSNPCLNNGTCLQQVTNSSLSITGSYLSFICICNTSLYTGQQCETPVSPCPTNPATAPCRNGGTCVPSANGQGFNCYCNYPYTGTNCDQIINTCQSNPCGPNGQCYTNIVTANFTCVCVNSTFTGPLCQNLTNPCLPSPCANGSTCLTIGSNFQCLCPPNLTGIYCGSILPPCTNTTCANNGTCLYSGSTVICLCPPQYTGPQCLQPILPCSSSPCLNNGTCLTQSANTFLCLCPPTWTGTLCGTLVNPCLTYTCFFGGTCVLNSAYQPVCICPSTYTGLLCQTPVSPCLSGPCFNNGTCLTNAANTVYTCQCPVLYTGAQCQNLVNPCTVSPCIYGTCYVLGNGTYYCACIANYTGLICDHPIDQCSLSPCVNNGTCISLGNSYLCLCPSGYTGLACQQIINPCSSNPCQTGTCYSTGTGFVCACDASHTGQFCQTLLNPCLSNPCLNNQTCLVTGANIGYTCICTLPYTGPRCASTILPCTTVVCLNGGTCVQTSSTTSQCLCPNGYSGTSCEVVVNPCQSQPCQNNGTCLSTSASTFLCLCLPYYSGTVCGQYNPCTNSTCLNGGTCVISPAGIGAIACICPPSYTGQSCATPISPCSSAPCVNNGVCLTIPGTANFTCVCTSAYTGVFCQTYINPCLSYFCGNNGTCYRTVTGTPICQCPSTYTGAQCLTQINPCLSSPCVNNGLCSSSLPNYNYTCLCPMNYTGARCENFIGSCTPTLCQNGGTCVYSGLNAISCICTPVWTGTLCTQRIDVCSTANPCLNSGICISIYNSTNQTTVVCQCLATYTGRYCETPVSPCQTLPCINGQCLLRADGTAICYCNSQWTGAACDTLISPCASQPCLNNGVCYLIGTNYTCLCLQGYSGLRCQITSPNLCTLVCANNGTCAIRATDSVQICVCPTGYTGTHCEIQISPCTPSPCLNNGLCLPSTYANGTLVFQCLCTAPYTGPLCANYISVCGNGTCLNGGTCLISGNTTICLCSSLFTGPHCGTMINPCNSQPCVNGGTCFATAVVRKKRQIITTPTMAYYCQCPPTYTGARCQTYVQLCGSNPCLHNGTCYLDPTLNVIHCLCTANYTGTFCNATVNGSNPCTANPSICYNGGTCRVNSTSSQGFSCQCTATTTGLFCEQPLTGCQLNTSICVNNGTCVTTLTGYLCFCPAGFTGADCSLPTNPCSSQPCFRNGTCLAMGTQSYTCVCPTGYSGARCEICNCACNIYPCLNGGVCRSTAAGGVICVCPAGYTGIRCETSSLPCDSNPCLNNGVCLYNPITMNMTCQCCGLATGSFCETLINPCNNTIPFCFNGGTCALNSSNLPVCICPANFTGLYCQTYTNPCSLVTCIQGTCVMLANSSFLCLCPTGRSGQYCQNVDVCASTPGTIPPCRNGGTCVRLTTSTYACLCPAGFTGAVCDIANPCSSMPCASNATCATLINGSAICICPPGVTGTSCNQTIPGSFCSSSPCLNNGTCVGTACICPNTTSGPTCNVTKTPCPTSTRPTLVCSNGGTCVPGYGCFCQAGFAGDGCDTLLPGGCTTSTCLNGGTCTVLSNGTTTCQCPAGYTGSTCQTPVSICTPNPCQSNGTCVPSGTTGYVCICPPNFTGAQCTLVTNPCLYTPCFNNGTCVQTQNGGYSCLCSSVYTGAQCQTVLNPCLSTPCNSGTCMTTNNGLAYICNCPPQLTGPTCLGANPCGLQPCLNGGTCVATGASTYSCLCPANFMGANCQTYNLCAQNPCLNNGTCTMLTSTTTSCTCTPAYYGNLCQYPNPCQNPICLHGLCQVNPTSLTAQCACYAGYTGTYCNTLIACLSNPCVYGTCVASSTTTGYICNCLPGYYGTQCQTPIVQTPCQSNPCHNGGTCQLTATNGYICTCPAYYVGTNCDYLNPCLSMGNSSSCQPVLTSSGNYTCSCSGNPCASNPCQYGTCVVANAGAAYSCFCYTGYLGNQCNIPNPCTPTTCYNSGTCIATVNNASTAVTQSCQCPASQNFVGTYCEHYNPCVSTPCLNGATCTYFINVTCFYRCNCPANYTGNQCQNSLTAVRCETFQIPDNCRNGATCVLIGTTPQCYCTSLYTGVLCENPINMCDLHVCQNNGTCTVVNVTSVSCQCPSGYQGTYCEYSTNACSFQPCLNGGQCISSGLTFSCNCAQTMYTGARCQTLITSPCVSNPCLNGGTCQIVSSSYVCLCPSSYTGPTCSQSVNLCASLNCLNGGSCTNYGTFAVCTCPISYTGDRCQYINQCYPNSPCLNGGTCIAILSSYSCQCPTGRTGTTCQSLSESPCASGYQCSNGGTCITFSGTTQVGCLCPNDYTGTSCDQAVSSVVQTTTMPTTLSSSIITIISPSSSSTVMITATSSIYFNTTSAPYACDDTALACLAYSAYCAPEIEFSGIPCRVLCPRTCNTCCEDFYTDGTCSLASCQANPQLQQYCRNTCICQT